LVGRADKLGVWGEKGGREENKVLDCKRFVELIGARSKRRVVT
jgi:hypothetical protein